jgi:hypothetical protein
VKFGSLIADIFHDAEVNAGNSVKMKHHGLIDFNALYGATLNHQTTYKKAWIKKLGGSDRHRLARRAGLKSKAG